MMQFLELLINSCDFFMIIVFVLGLIAINLIILCCPDSNSDQFNNEYDKQNSNKDNEKILEDNINDEIKNIAKLDSLEIISRIDKLGAKFDMNAYNTLLQTCIIQGRIDEFRMLIYDINGTMPIKPTLKTFNHILRFLNDHLEKNEHKNFPDAERCLTKMRIFDIYPTNETYNLILKLYSTLNYHELVLGYFESMNSKYDLKPDETTYCILINHLKNCLRKQEYLSYIEEIEQYIIEYIETINEVLLEDFIEMCQDYNNIEKIQRVLDALAKSNKKLPITTYKKLEDICKENKMYDKMMYIYHQIKNDKDPQTIDVIRNILITLAKCDKLKYIKQMYNEINELDISILNSTSYIALICAFAKKNKFNMTYGIFLQMKSQLNQAPNLLVYNNLLNCCVKSKKYKEMERIIQDLEGIEANMITYSTIIKGLCDNHKIEKALEIYHLVKSKGLTIDTILYNTLLDGISQLESSIRTKSLGVLILDMKKGEIPYTDGTYNILLKIYCKADDLSHTMETFLEMIEKKITPSIISCTRIIQLLIRKNAQDVMSFYKEIIKLGVKPDSTFYTLSIGRALEFMNYKLAAEILCESIDENERLSNNIYKNVINAILNDNEFDFNGRVHLLNKIYNYTVVNKVQMKRDIIEKMLFQISQYYYP